MKECLCIVQLFLWLRFCNDVLVEAKHQVGTGNKHPSIQWHLGCAKGLATYTRNMIQNHVLPRHPMVAGIEYVL